MSDTALPLLKGVIAAMKADSSVAALVSTRVYSDIPQNETFPYVRVQINSSDYSAKDFAGMEHTVQIQAFSRDKSPKNAGDIMAACYAVLNRNESGIALDNGTLSHIHYSGVGFIEMEPDGVTWQGLRQFRAVVT